MFADIASAATRFAINTTGPHNALAVAQALPILFYAVQCGFFESVAALHMTASALTCVHVVHILTRQSPLCSDPAFSNLLTHSYGVASRHYTSAQPAGKETWFMKT